jgi:hypothetical protein
MGMEEAKAAPIDDGLYDNPGALPWSTQEHKATAGREAMPEAHAWCG